jgi:two-component system KDP operon response regulator KdpE
LDESMISGSILVASNLVQQRRDLQSALCCEGHLVTASATGCDALDQIAKAHWDLLVVDSRIGDSQIGDADLFSVCRTVRSVSNIGIIAILHDSDGQCRIDALNAGADDYIAGPYATAELQARVRALLRRVRCIAVEQWQLALDDRLVDLRSHKVHGPDGRTANLTPKEFQVLKLLIDRMDKPVSYAELARSVWRRDVQGDLEYVRIVVSQLRRKLEPDCNRPRYILTEYSVGYRFTMPRALFAPTIAAQACETGIPAMAR